MANQTTSAARAPEPLLSGTAGTVAMLAAMAAVGQFANSIYLPSFPAMQAALGASGAEVRLTLTAYLVTFGVGQLLHGPLADRFGRRTVLFWGLVLFVLASAACALAPTVEALIAARVAQALGACAGMVVSRAVVRDAFEGAEMSRVMAAITMSFAAVPAVAPFLGGASQDLLGWRASFVIAAVAGLAIHAIAWRRLPETNRMPLPSLDLRAAFARYGPVLRARAFQGHAAVSAAGLGGIFAFHAGAPDLFIGHIGISATEFGVYPPLTVTGFFLGGWAVRRLLPRWGERRLMLGGGATLAAGGALMVAMAAGGWIAVAPLIAATWVYAVGMGIVLPMSIAGAVRDFPERAGTASAALGFCQMMAGALATVLVSAFALLGPAAFPAAMLVLALIAAGAALWVEEAAAG